VTAGSLRPQNTPRTERFAIVGCAGSGKSWLARRLGEILDVPVTHLDDVFYDDAWNELPMEKFAAVQRELIAQRRWVIDGNYNSTLSIRLAACGTVIFLDVSTLAALRGVFTRQIRHGAGHQGDGMHNRIRWGVIRYVTTYRCQMRPHVVTKIEEFAAGHAEVILLTNRRTARRWLQHIAARHTRSGG
jgi:adenylate kinase family enzyme